MELGHVALSLFKSLVSGVGRAGGAARGALPLPDVGAEGAAESAAVPTDLRELMAGFDLRRITPREFSELLTRLRASGGVDAADAELLAPLRFELDREQAEADAPIDLVAWSRERLALAEGRAASGRPPGESNQATDIEDQLTMYRRQTAWIERLARTGVGDLSSERLNRLI